MSDQFNQAKGDAQAKADDARAEADRLHGEGQARLDARDDELDASIERLRGHSSEQQTAATHGFFGRLKERFTGGG